MTALSDEGMRRSFGADAAAELGAAGRLALAAGADLVIAGFVGRLVGCFVRGFVGRFVRRFVGAFVLVAMIDGEFATLSCAPLSRLRGARPIGE